ncbi:helix-turn-helix domain-containing protein [Streptomyces mayteni]
MSDDSDDLVCHNAGCTNALLKKPGAGRPRKWCSEQCRRSANRTPASEPSGDAAARHTGYVVELAEELRGRADELLRLARDPALAVDVPMRFLDLLETVRRDLNDLQAAAMQQARDRGARVVDLAARLSVSADTISRLWPADVIDRRMAKRQTVGESHPIAPASDPPAADSVPPPRRPRTGTGPSEGPVATLARALSHLQRSSGRRHRRLGYDAGVSPSYISRVMSGERCPSWPVARSITRSCGGDPDDIRPLWEATRGIITPTPHGFHAALRGLYLAAARPDDHTLRRSTQGLLTSSDITRLLHGAGPPTDWPTVDRLVHALHGDPTTIRPLWEAARHAAPRSHSATRHGPVPRGLPAAAFG